MFRLLNAYNNALKSRPLFVTSVTTGVCYLTGDYIAQSIEKSQGKRDNWDHKRLGVFGVFGLIAGGPIYYTWFSKINNMPIFIENIVKWNEKRILSMHFRSELGKYLRNDKIGDMSMKKFRENYKAHFDTIDKPIIRSKTILVAKIYADQFIFSILYPIFFMMSTGTMIHVVNNPIKNYLDILNSVSQGFNKSWINVKNKFVQIYVADCAVWPLVQMANFAFVPGHLQPIFINFINIGWNTYLSYVSQGH